MPISMIRHGESTFNSLWLVQWHSEKSILTERWKEQVFALGKKVKGMVFENVYVSDLIRAKQTWEILSKYICTENIIFSPELREQWQGMFEWKPYDSPDFQRMKYHETLRDATYDSLCRKYHAEMIQDFEQRVQSFLDMLMNQRKQILCITHGGVIGLYSLNKPIENAEIFTLPF